MSKQTESYRQCKLSRVIPNGSQHTVSWIPDCFANLGEVLKLKGVDGNWVDGWIVESVSSPMDAKTVEANSRLHLNQRAASDIVFADVKRANEAADKNNRGI